jgi:hypothetical protein
MVKATRQMAPKAQKAITTLSVLTVGAHFSMGQAQSQLLGKASFKVRGYILVVGLKSLSMVYLQWFKTVARSLVDTINSSRRMDSSATTNKPGPRLVRPQASFLFTLDKSPLRTAL